jgi:3-deoxy-7-phosphoheptulonate synthase
LLLQALAGSKHSGHGYRRRAAKGSSLAKPVGDDSTIIVMGRDATRADIDHVVERLHDIGAEAHVSEGQLRTVIGAIGDRSTIQQLPWEAFPGVERAVPVLKPYQFVSRDHHSSDTVVEVGGVPVGGDAVTVIAGPCAVESRDQLFSAASAVKGAGATILRGDAFKPRTSPDSFQGLGEKGLEILAEARQEFELPFVAEVVDPRDIDLVSSYADLIRIGTRNMANYPLLAEVGRQPKPVLLKRGFTATIEEWLNAAEYVYKEGNHAVILCERGIRTFETQTRNTLDISAVPVVKGLSHLPVIIDPSHSGGRRHLVAPLALAGVAAGADGLIVDVHPAPETALVDGAQALLPDEFAALMEQVHGVASAVGRSA